MIIPASGRISVLFLLRFTHIATTRTKAMLSTPRRSPRSRSAVTTVSVVDPSTPQLTFEEQEASPPPSRRRKDQSGQSTPTNTTHNYITPNDLFKDSKYVDLKVAAEELRPSHSLTNGQCFHWQAIHDENEESTSSATKQSAWGTHDAKEWLGTLRFYDPSKDESQHVVLSVQETPTTTLYRVLGDAPPTLNVDSMLRKYFQLDVPLQPLYEEWSQSCARLKIIASCLPGVRLLEQDPFECLVSFICSTNNNIPRISKMLGSIRREYGSPLMESVGSDNLTLYSFPSLKVLYAKATEDDLRTKVGMGYRAKYLISTLELLTNLGGEAYLHTLRNNGDAAQVQEALMQFAGVGAKVADCVALFSLRQANAIPVDVHVLNICQRDYDDSIKQAKSMTPTIYSQVGDCFRQRFPNRAGWAHSLLFCAELPSFRPTLPANLVEDMDRFSKEERERKQELKKATKKRKIVKN